MISETNASPTHPHAPCREPDLSRRRGLLIVFEGIDGSGKSTQARLLADRLRREGLPVLLTSEPSDGPVGVVIKSSGARLALVEEMRLFMEDRRDHVKRTIGPALQGGTIVICDRYVYSSAAYQGARGLDPAGIIAENFAFAPRPDITFLLEIPVEAGLDRIKSGRAAGFSAFEVKEELEKVARVYHEIGDPCMVRLDGLDSAEAIHNEIVTTLVRLGLRFPSSGGSERTQRD